MYVVCCEPRVIVCGWATPDDVTLKHPTLHEVRMCVYWDKPTGGPMGLAGIGPQEGCRITKAAPSICLRTKIEAHLECSENAIQKWESEPWRA